MSADAPNPNPAPAPAPAPAPVSPPAPAPAPAPAPGWLAGAPDEIRNHPAIASIPDGTAAAKELIGQSAMLGRKGVILPIEGDANDLKRFHKEIGVPDSGEGYTSLNTFEAPRDLPTWSPELVNKMRPVLLESGVTDVQAGQLLAGMAKAQLEDYQGIATKAREQRESHEAVLQLRWGTNYDANVKLAHAAWAGMMKGSDGIRLTETMMPDGALLGDNPYFAEMLYKTGKLMREGKMLGDALPGFGKDPETAKSEIATLKADSEFMRSLQNPAHPLHQENTRRYDLLYEQAVPNERAPGGVTGREV